MFKERLMITLEKLGKGVVYIVFAHLFIAIPLLSQSSKGKFPLVEKVFLAVVGLLVIFIVVNLIWLMGLLVCSFIKWLFIEPYMESKKEKS